ncbi:SSI family serine proteinase inhibitor [Streptomyces sp. NPDC051315]|uniref:SSI family serine proteinase inhibitor n=1 Tax=Streptomyces sp. NPDC051315 TaxID=3365650 RepID=UPI0037876029
MKHFPTPHPRGALPVAAALVFAAVAVAPARASAPRDSLPANWLRITVTHGDARTGDSRGTLLLCDPPRGHSRAAEACADLAAAGGDIHAIPPKDGICSLVYAPVTAQARGWWNRRPVGYAKTFANACVMQAETGAVFALDDERPRRLPDLSDLPGT